MDGPVRGFALPDYPIASFLAPQTTNLSVVGYSSKFGNVVTDKQDNPRSHFAELTEISEDCVEGAHTCRI